MAEKLNSNLNQAVETSSMRNGSFSPRWGAVFSGLVVAILLVTLLSAIGLTFGGSTLPAVIEGLFFQADLGPGAGAWAMLVLFVSLFAAGYVAGRHRGQGMFSAWRLECLLITGIFFWALFSSGRPIGPMGVSLRAVAPIPFFMGFPAAGAPNMMGLMNQGPLIPPQPGVPGAGPGSPANDGSGASMDPNAQQQAQAGPQAVPPPFPPSGLEAELATAARAAGWVLSIALVFSTLACLGGGYLGASGRYRIAISAIEADREESERAA